MSNKNIGALLDEVARSRGIPRNILINAIENGIALAAQRKTGKNNLRASFDTESGAFSLVQMKIVKEEPTGDDAEITPDEAERVTGKRHEPGTVVPVPFGFSDLGRLAAVTTRKMMEKTMAEIESDHRYAELAGHKWTMVSAVIRTKRENGDLLCDVGETPAEIPLKEQAFREKFKNGEIIKALVIDVGRKGMDCFYILSRTHPLLLRFLLMMEVPEIADGTVLIKSLARDTAGRSKVAVASVEKDIDAVGACIGPGGSRVRRIISELKGENIDVIPWSDDPEKLIAASLMPARVKSVRCRPETHEADVELEPDQQSVAVGKKGLNIRLASRLTHWIIKVAES